MVLLAWERCNEKKQGGKIRSIVTVTMTTMAAGATVNVGSRTSSEGLYDFKRLYVEGLVIQEQNT